MSEARRFRLHFLLLAIAVLAAAVSVAARYILYKPVSEAEDNSPIYGKYWTGRVPTPFNAPTKLSYHVFLPDAPAGRALPVLICVGGVNSEGGEFMKDKWKRFAMRNGFCLLALGFVYKTEEITLTYSYQHPEDWAGAAVNEILDRLSADEPIDRHRLFLFGFSAGAQFVHRYALLYPGDCKAVAAFAAGGYTQPSQYIATEFFIGVGSKDDDRPSRLAMARKFVRNARKLGIKADLFIEEDAGHGVNAGQIEQAWKFLADRRAP